MNGQFIELGLDAKIAGDRRRRRDLVAGGHQAVDVLVVSQTERMAELVKRMFLQNASPLGGARLRL